LPEATSEDLKEAMQWFYDLAPNFHDPNESFNTLVKLFGKVNLSSSPQFLPHQISTHESDDTNDAWEIFCEREPYLG